MTIPPDYSKIIDAETWTFIRDTESWYPPETATFSIARQRAVYDAMCRAFHRGYPAGVSASDMALGGVPVRVFSADKTPTATVVYFHGGGFVAGGLNSHDDICADICAATGFRVVAADYRLAPEHRHPAQFDDAVALTEAVAATYRGPLLLAGDSAGGNLAAAVSHATRGAGPRGGPGLGIVGQVLIYPGLGGDDDAGSYLTHADAPMLTRADILLFSSMRYSGGAVPVGDPTAWPLQDSDFAGLPPTLIHVAECDPLCDDGAAYAAAITRAGGQARNTIEPGMVHGYLRARTVVARARDSFTRITAGILALGQGRWPDSAE